MRKNLVALYGVQVATLVLPLLSIPFLARVLGPSALGELAAIQSLFATLGFLIEYGFGLSATRQVAIHRDSRSELTKIFSNVLGGKLLLSVLFLLVSLAVYIFIPVFRSHPLLFWLGFLGALFQGFNLMWFYQGIEKLPRAASIDISLKFGYTALVLLLVRSPNDVALVIMLQGLSSLLSLIINTWRALPHIEHLRITLGGSLSALKDGRSMFLFRAVSIFYTNANTALLRLFVPAATVAQYSTAERLTGISSSALWPIMQVFFPRLSYLVHHDFSAAQALFRKTFVIIVGVSTLAAIFGFFSAPIIIKFIFGDQFISAVPLFQILIFNLPIIAISQLFGLQWMIPNQMERTFNKIIAVAAICNLISVVFIVPKFGAMGMAWGVVASEIIVTTSMIASVLKSSKSPFKITRPNIFTGG